jgi:hypothetical protein
MNILDAFEVCQTEAPIFITKLDKRITSGQVLSAPSSRVWAAFGRLRDPFDR